MVDKNTILQIIGSLMKRPQYLNEKDKYMLLPEDFSTFFEKYIFSAIFNLSKDGAQQISVLDIDSYFDSHPVAKETFENNKGIEYLQDALDYAIVDNFPVYYKRLKKFNAIKDLKKMGFDTSSIYSENLLDKKSKEINERFETLEVSDIFDTVKGNLMKLEASYSLGDSAETIAAHEGIKDLLTELSERPEVGSRLQGEIFNTICRGARKTKFYIRSASSGVGKSRAAVGDACYLSYPIRFNTQSWEWEWNGSSEKTLFIATEQEHDEIQTLVLAYLTGFNEEKILYSNYTSEEKEVMKQATRVMEHYKNNLYVVRLSDPSIERLRAVVRQSWIMYDIQNVFYDYIFSSPSLLNEFRDLRIREDVALGMLSTALKDLAVEMGLFILSSTQTNAKSEDAKAGVKNESVIRGSRAIIDKSDIACVMGKVTPEEIDILEEAINRVGIIPNQVLDIYKVRRGRYTNVRVWSQVDLGTCRKQDLFLTDDRFNLIEDFRTYDFLFEDNDEVFEIHDFLEKINAMSEKEEEEKEEPKIEIDSITEAQQEAKGIFGDLL